VVPVLAASAVWLNIPPMVYGLLQLETIQVFLIALAAAAGMACIVGGKARQGVVAGLFIGLAMWAKPTAGAIAPALALGLFIRTDWPVAKRLRSIATLALGALIPLIVCTLLVVHLGMADALPATMKQLRDYSANSTAAWVDAIKPLFVAMVLLFPLLVLGWVFRRDRIDVEKREQSCDAVAARRALVAFVIAWFAMETIAVVAQRRMYAYHFLVMGPPAAMLLALAARRLRVVSLGFALGPAALMCVLWAGQIFSLPNDQKRLESIIAYLRTHSDDSDCVWLDDYPRLMVETDLKPGSRVPLVFLFGNSDPAPLYFGDMILTDLQSRRPERIVLYQDPSRYVDFYRHHMVEIAEFPQRGQNFDTAWHAIDRYTRVHYEIETTIDRMNVYRRKSGTSEEVEHTATLTAGE
jgi:hypothetical protein